MTMTAQHPDPSTIKGLPLMMALATKTPFDAHAMVADMKSAPYDAHRQVGPFDPESIQAMGRSTCNVQSSTGIFNLDNDRQQDD